MSDSPPKVSIVIPAFNEAECIPLLAAGVLPLVESLEAEVIVVDDGSTDGTLDILQRYPGLRCLSLPHAGKTTALRKGVEEARSLVIVTIDADLQEDPIHIAELLKALDSGADMVIGCRVRRADGLWSKRLPSAIYRLLIRFLFGCDFQDINCGLRAAPKHIFLSALSFEGAHRVVPLVTRLRGCTVSVVPVGHRRRRCGRPKFQSPVRFFQSLRDLMRIWLKQTSLLIEADKKGQSL